MEGNGESESGGILVLSFEKVGGGIACAETDVALKEWLLRVECVYGTSEKAAIGEEWFC